MRELRAIQQMNELNQKIKEIDEKIIEIRARIESPKNQIISDMPRGGGSTNNAIESAIIKIDTLEAKKHFLVDRLVSEWLIFENTLNSCDVKEKQLELMRYRFLNGLSWKGCVKAMAKAYKDEPWNENKVFRIYRQVISKCTKNNSKVC